MTPRPEIRLFSKDKGKHFPVNYKVLLRNSETVLNRNVVIKIFYCQQTFKKNFKVALL